MITRREFLKTSATVAAGTLVAKEGFASSATRKPQVVVIGAGLSGLAAGYALTRKNYDVTILETRKRVGGRVFSHQIDAEENLVVELGGEWVGESHERVIALCKEFGLELFDNRFHTNLLYRGEYLPKGKWAYSADWQAKWNRLMTDYAGYSDKYKRKLDKMDWWRFLVKQGIPERDLELRELLDSTDFGETIRSVSGYAALAEYAESGEYNEMDFKIEGGNGRLAEELARRIGSEKIKFDHEVLSINQTGRRVVLNVHVGGQSQQTFECDRVVCSIPTFALSKIVWTPALPENKIWALDALQYARINKTAVLFEERFWKDEDFDLVTDVYGHYFYHATKSQPGKKGVLIAYVCGDKAEVIGKQSEEFRKNVIVETLRPAFGDVSKLIATQATYYWGTDKYSKGAYALYGKGQWFGLMPELKTRFMKVSFAGEHLADWQGFMEGAVNTGEAAAEEIMG